MEQINSLVNQDGDSSHKYQSYSYLRNTITTATMTIAITRAATTAPAVAPTVVPDLFSVPDI